MGRALVLLVAAVAMVLGSLAVVAMAKPGAGARIATPPPSIDPAGPDASVPPPMAAADLYGLVGSTGAMAESYGDAVSLETTDAGAVVLPSGRLVGSDGMLFTDLPFTTIVGPGTYPVSLLTAEFPGSGDHRVAAAILRVADGEPVAWEMALVEGQDLSQLGPDEIFGYGVDSGSGAFTSPEAVAILADETAYQAYSDTAFATMFPDDQTIVDSAVVEVDGPTGANVVTFSSGFGDGAYATYVGLDAAGEPLVFVTDFGVLDATSS